MAVTVTLEPAGRCRWDEPVRIAVRGLAPGQPVTLRASLRDEKGALFRAHARYCADAAGLLDLERAPALGGSFAGLEPMGLFWALEPEEPLTRLVKRDVQTPFVVELEVLDGHEPEAQRLLGRAVHERDFLAPGVRREPVRAGRVRATLFLPPGSKPFPGILDLFGSSGGLCEYRASLLAGHGFAVLALAYFRFEDLPEHLNDMCLEYFEEAVNFMLQHPKVKGPGVGLLGYSKGGDLCLSMASFLKGITATVVINACVANTLAPLRYKDMIIPELSYDLEKYTITESGFLNFVDIWGNPLEKTNHQSLIPLEKAQGPFLFIVSMDDHNWKSEVYARIASERLQAHGKDRPQIIYYPGTGHCIDPPYFPLCRGSVHAVLGQPIFHGGEPKAHSNAQADAWQQIQTFFHKHLNGKKSVRPSKL
ncbi:acyl-coenzyme A thioesterase 6 isoform X1 [Bubalus kerabau]|uniref:putative acyl-coenzyme A thioesterase 6 isoform X1 n=2 Tax=Bubalus bubalis TaxID=89462 RepID=UPI001D10619B|nr:putative acyl-coenzyme A thioesterase 6 isoform X1 [Bubalus bubalis]XP_055394577.1 acyl-coenzyme A thioesterase 6 isoform X1 [Bubalus carabanensis]